MDLNKTNDIVTKLELASNSIEKQYFINKDITNKKLIKLTLTGHVFRKCNFYASKFFNCKFINCEFLDCDFTGTDLLDVRFENCTLSQCNFTRAKLQDFIIEGGYKMDCNFNNVEIINNVNGIDNINNIISDSKRQENLDKGTNNFFKKLNKLDHANNFIKSKDEYYIEINDTCLSIVKDPEAGNNIWRIIVSKNGDSIYSDTVKGTIAIEALQLEILGIIDAAKSIAPEINDLTIVDDLTQIEQLINLTGPVIEEENKAEINDLTELKEYIDKQFDRLFNILNQKLK